MPTLGANSLNGVFWGAFCAVAASLSVGGEFAYAVHGGAPQIKASVNGAVGRVASVAETGGIFACSRFLVGVVQVLGHPDLIADFDGSVDLSVAFVLQFAGSYRLTVPFEATDRKRVIPIDAPKLCAAVCCEFQENGVTVESVLLR